MKGMFLVAIAVLATSACASTPTASAPPSIFSETRTIEGELKGCTPGEDVFVMVDGKQKRARCDASKQRQIGTCTPADAKAGTQAKCTRF